ncbi:uncharacterized protein si:ch211-106e7.2 [Phycodurus eques]|uniref:uncharacterized protein si:ch211-106e7.2 n=1 Tax=Phycodurus eques TaxID=693459 RepID=UPI002ACD9AAC|nr:uncharacterized protein si:ch211-106e7.2 [Phycodurus eques]XP_061532711.1 uncharacterized protein si:ch211-106e7.2 [Phycodurus eques]XP_061532712.1 uncharacterized protein si:ch211-106e7.2 [Phycodurus eques]XP_061532713.1 uncharacterized protein si:ch211-106e7.2 [Phycodurus eques]XP_061532714.1 uncharacterized protein si:ch211-106e7.2 [Phycodurus eques]
MYLAWLNLDPSSQHLAQLTRNTVDPGVKPQQSATSYENGPTPKWESTQVSHQTAGGKHVGYQRTFVNIHKPSCNVQGGQPFHGDGCQNTVNNSSIKSGSDLMLKTMCYQDEKRQFTLEYRPTPPTSNSNMSSPALQHSRNEGLHEAYNKVSSRPKLVTFPTATTLQVIQEVSKRGAQSSSAHNTGISVDKTKYTLYPSAHTGNVFFNLKNVVVRPPSTGQSLQVSSLNQPTKQFSSTVFDGSQTNSSPAAEMRHNIIGTPLLGSSYQQTATRQRERLVTADSKVARLTKSLPLLSRLILAPGSVTDSTQPLSTNNLNDNSSSARVVAVVQPLSPHCNTMTCASKSPATHNFNVPTVDTQNKMTTEDCRNPLERQIQLSNKSLSMHMSATGHADDLLCEEVSVHTSATKQSDDTLSKGHCIGACAPQRVNVEAPEKDKWASNKDEMPLNAKASIFQLSALPTTKWTLKELALLGEGLEMHNAPKNDDLRKQLLVMFWGGSVKNLVSILKAKSYSVLLNCAHSFCAHYGREDAVVLSQVDSSFADQLQYFHVLKDGEVYTEPPYTSSWLNKNEQLDDIDKEFGPNISRNVSDNQPGPVKRVTDIPTPTLPKAPRLDLETVDKECNDSLYLFKIEVLPPEEAKAIFEQGHVMMSQTKPSISQPEEVTNTLDAVVDEPVQELHVTSGSKVDGPIQHFCCIAKWKESMFGSKTLLKDKCQCNEERCKPTKKQEQMNCQQFTMEPDLQSHSLDKDMESDSEEKRTASLPTINWLEICNEISGTFELNDDEETNDLHEQQPRESQPTIVSVNKENVSNCENITNRIPDIEEGCNKAQLKSAESCQSTDSSSRSSDRWTENQIETPISPIDEHGGQAPMASKSPLDTEQIQCSAKPGDQTDVRKPKAHETDGRKRKRRNNANSVFPYLKKLMNKNMDSHEVEDVSKTKIVVGSDRETLADKRTVQLKLFGSLPQEKCILVHRHNESTTPPNVVYARVDEQKLDKSGLNSFGSATKRTLSQTKKKLGAKMKAIRDRQKKFGSQNYKPVVDQQRKSFKHDRRTKETGTQAVLPIQENVLKFSVLPNSFSFEDESAGERERTENSSDEPLSESGKKSPNKKSRVDVWSHFPVKESSSVHPVPGSKSADVFAEYQKKYTEKSQPSVTP